MRRLLCAALAALALLALPSAAGARAPLVVGIGEQGDAIFASKPWYQLGSRDVRYIVAWDALDVKWERAEVDRYMAAAGAAAGSARRASAASAAQSSERTALRLR